MGTVTTEIGSQTKKKEKKKIVGRVRCEEEKEKIQKNTGEKKLKKVELQGEENVRWGVEEKEKLKD